MEVVNKCLELYLRCLCQERPKTWSEKLAWTEYWYNTNYHASIKTTPYAVVYGQPPPPICSYGQVSTTPNDSVEYQLQNKDETLAVLKQHLQQAQEQMKKFFDVHRREVVFDIGDWVYLKLQPYRQQSVAKRRCDKLCPKYFGPYMVLGRVGEVAYLLDLPENAKIHPVFHVSQLKRAVGDKHRIQPDISALNDQMELVLVPDQVTQLRWNDAERDWEYLVHWKDQPSHEATWESYATLVNQFPDFHLEDKVTLLLGGIARPPITQVYHRKRKKGFSGPNIGIRASRQSGRWKKMMQKMIEDRLTASEAEIEAIKQKDQRLPLLKKNLEKVHAMLSAIYEDRQRQLGGLKMTGISTGKRKLRNEDTAEEEGEEGETSLSVETGA
ncbi:ty3-gypsy retrotransposon protein [Cucumis melo var. makuwa]|uniref:Ty3-gypsy retrotransposon protein n=1 Tax=Cucumis melo var. makuwa TaxID=1194695 RepID=A0A5A7SRH1_CUCMM|nr:ty3-gypsy retrotransposon protein [Cucumis melo var. makuwa]